MSLDLFFVAKKPDFATLRAADFAPTPALLRARRKLIDAICAHWPGTTLVGDPSRGHLAGFPVGELTLAPGYLSWSLHGVEDEAPIHAIVNWFLAQQMVCEDPQDAGFGNRDLKRGQQRDTLESFDELVGAQFVGVRLLRDWVSGLATEWILADGSVASVQFAHFRASTLPDLGLLIGSRVVAVDYQTTGQVYRLIVRFSGDLEWVIDDAIFHKSSVVRAVAAS